MKSQIFILCLLCSFTLLSQEDFVEVRDSVNRVYGPGKNLLINNGEAYSVGGFQGADTVYKPSQN
ncbi:MAG: hypothetical protein AAFU67_10810, partial [Bacteroidota bacterium]